MTMKAMIKRLDGLSLAGKGDSNHWLNIDASKDVGGEDAASRPLELVLLGLGGCTSLDVLSILKKKRIHLDDYECFVEAERAEEHPKVFTKILIKFVFYGEHIPKEAVERAIELSEKTYCSVTAMLRKSAEITIEYEIKSSIKERA
jgi:putative redox protein